ncbi:MAG TPA: hypothetical protein VG474_11780 [Solirubrobacteraceae bacterium]|nr:hypothetical protein [Solirubrobacteraceae bacterium]
MATSVGFKCRVCTGADSARSRRWRSALLVMGLVAIGAAGLLALVGSLAAGGDGELGDEPRATAADAAIREQELSFAGPGGGRLQGGLLIPYASDGAPAALLLTDRPTGRRTFHRAVAEALARQGFVVLTYRPGAEHGPMRLRQATAALRALTRRAEVAGAVVAVGHEAGGLDALRLAADEREVVALALVSTGGEELDEALPQIEPAAGEVDVPVLIVRGAADRGSTAADARRLHDLLHASPQVDRATVPGAGSTLRGDRLALHRLALWLRRVAAAAPMRRSGDSQADAMAGDAGRHHR